MPSPAKESVYRQLNDVLSSKNSNPVYSHLAADDRRAIREILNDTKRDWKTPLDSKP